MIVKNKSNNLNDIAAIVPAFNEEIHIKNVVNTLVSSGLFKEIIVVDDGSTDGTFDVIKDIKGIKHIKNVKNMGKGASIDMGVKLTKSPILFFCDADLRGVTKEHLMEIVTPVLERRYPMFIGVRKNIFQNATKKSSLNSGERAMIREVWENLPEIYKKGFRMETALNKFVENSYGSFGFKKLDYLQTMKEQKHGILLGFKKRLEMMADETISWFLIVIYERFKRSINHIIKK